MRLGYAILYVADVPATVAFYEQAFGLTRRMVHEGVYGEMETGATRLAFAARDFVRGLIPLGFAESADVPPPVEIGLVTDDVPAAFAQALAAGARAVKPPETKPWGQVVGYVRDNNGFLVELCSPLPD